jgi:signal transduction histidine kinase
MEIHVDGRPRPLAPALDQSAYRILQESLTNAARHGSGRADVQIAYGQGHLELAISNPLPPVANGEAVQGGHGILGMRERAALLGGTLEAGPTDGRFHVHTRLPYVASEATR